MKLQVGRRRSWKVLEGLGRSWKVLEGLGRSWNQSSDSQIMFRYFRFINQSDSVILVLSLQLLLLAIFLLHMYTICLSNELLSFLASRGAGNWIWPTWPVCPATHGMTFPVIQWIGLRKIWQNISIFHGKFHGFRKISPENQSVDWCLGQHWTWTSRCYGAPSFATNSPALRCATNDPIAMELTSVATPASNKSEKMEDTRVYHQGLCCRWFFFGANTIKNHPTSTVLWWTWLKMNRI